MRDVLRLAPGATMVVKSTVPVGYIEDVRARLGTADVIFSPEFLREGRALHDNLHPARIVVGEDSDRARAFAELLVKGAELATDEERAVNPRATPVRLRAAERVKEDS